MSRVAAETNSVLAKRHRAERLRRAEPIARADDHNFADRGHLDRAGRLTIERGQAASDSISRAA